MAEPSPGGGDARAGGGNGSGGGGGTPGGSAGSVSCGLTPQAGNDNGSIAAEDGSNGHSTCWGQQTGVYAGTGDTEAQIEANPSGLGFTHLSGTITATNGETFNHDYITGCIGIPNGANNVTIENTLIVDSGNMCEGGDDGAQSSLVNDGNNSGPTGLTMINDTLDTSQGSGGGSADFPLNVINATLVRVNAFGGPKELDFGQAGNMTVEDSYFHAPCSCGGEHEDVVFANGGNTCCNSQVTFEHDYMEADNPSSSAYEQGAFVILSGSGTAGQVDSDITVDSSFMVNLNGTADASWGVGCAPEYNATARNIVSTNNVFENSGGTSYLNDGWDSSSANTWSGNTTVNPSGQTEGTTPTPGC